jgi:hypothetical protein
MKVSKRTNRICLGLAIATLVAIFCYQVAYSTNESDYKHGYKFGLYGYKQCHINHICAIEENTFTSECGNAIGPDRGPYIYNETACQHGYHHGWVKACLNDGGGAMCTA